MLREQEAAGYVSQPNRPRVVVMVPTLELVSQVGLVAKKLAHHVFWTWALNWTYYCTVFRPCFPPVSSDPMTNRVHPTTGPTPGVPRAYLKAGCIGYAPAPATLYRGLCSRGEG